MFQLSASKQNSDRTWEDFKSEASVTINIKS